MPWLPGFIIALLTLWSSLLWNGECLWLGSQSEWWSEDLGWILWPRERARAVAPWESSWNTILLVNHYKEQILETVTFDLTFNFGHIAFLWELQELSEEERWFLKMQGKESMGKWEIHREEHVILRVILHTPIIPFLPPGAWCWQKMASIWRREWSIVFTRWQIWFLTLRCWIFPGPEWNTDWIAAYKSSMAKKVLEVTRKLKIPFWQAGIEWRPAGKSNLPKAQ